MRRILAAILLIAVLVLGAGWIASGAYQAGLAAGAAGAAGTAAGGGTVVVPAYGPGWWGFGGFGWPGFGLGFGFFGLIGAILFFVLLAGLFRFAVFGPRGRHHPRGPFDGPGRGDWFEARHRQAHAAGLRAGEPGPDAGIGGAPGAPRIGDLPG